jgi:sugar phosphate isomerase/epimerase
LPGFRHRASGCRDRQFEPAQSLGSFPPNHSSEAWAELRLIVGETLRVAADHGVTLLLKPENSQLLASAADVLRLREELPHPCLRFVMDPAAFLLECRPAELDSQMETLFAQGGPWAPLVHLKDLRFHAAGVSTSRAGCRVLNFSILARLLHRYQPDARVILEHLRPEEVAEAKARAEQFLSTAGVAL